jgi:hypothetical protein
MEDDDTSTSPEQIPADGTIPGLTNAASDVTR